METITYAVWSARCNCGFVASGRSVGAVDSAMAGHFEPRYIDYRDEPANRRLCFSGNVIETRQVTAPKQSQFLKPIGIMP